MWPRMILLTTLIALLGGSPTADAAHARPRDAQAVRGHSALPHRDAGPAASDPGPSLIPTPQRAVLGSWSWPLAPPHSLARPYLAPPTRYGAGHRGIDLRASAGAPVLAPDDGVVHFAGVVVDRPVLSIAHDGGVLSSYEPVSTALVAGDAVTRGEVIGTLLPGHCETPCLHLGARIDGEYVNPLLYLGGMPWSVLLPAG